MTCASYPRLLRLLRLLSIALAGSLLSGQAALAEPITFAHKNWSDLRGILNVFDAFKQACLAQPMAADLPERLLPDGYRIVPAGLHALGFESGSEPRTVVLSRTGDEEKDFEQGEPFIELGLPTDAAPNGQCRVVWQRAWDYPEGVQDVMTSTTAIFDGWLSFQLKAVRVSRPEDGFTAGKFYSNDAEWAAPCFDGTWCRISLIFTVRLDEGIYLTMRRGDPPSTPGGG